MVCWLIAWAGTPKSSVSESEALRLCGRMFVNKLFAKSKEIEVELGDEIHVELEHQLYDIDILVRIDHRYVLLIEVMQGTYLFDGRINENWDSVCNGETVFGSVEDCVPIYLKTGNLSPTSRESMEAYGVIPMFDRADFRGILDTYDGCNPILLDFRQHLAQLEKETHSFMQWTKEAGKSQLAWEGLYAHIEENLKESAGGRSPLGALSDCYSGVEIVPGVMSRNCQFILRIMQDRIGVLVNNLNHKRSTKQLNREKLYWTSNFVKNGQGLFVDPEQEHDKNEPICVAEWIPNEDEGWLAYGQDGRLDIAASLDNIYRVIEIVKSAVKRGG